ncbi:MAG TPA: hypothetical protein VK934_12820 [Fimbriimonas sp.]|nr:hypothetical protein [Fimbriimonas sp.]
MTSSQPDKLVIFTAIEGAARETELAEQRILENNPDQVTPTRELMGRFPAPTDQRALDLILQVRNLHRESEGEALVRASDRYRKQFGWNPRVEWFRVLGLELIHAPELIGEQRRFLHELYDAKSGMLPRNSTPTERPLAHDVLDWAIGANHWNLMQWLWKAGHYEEALVQFPRSFAGLEANGDKIRRIDRHLYKASCLYRIGQKEQAKNVLTEARSIDDNEFQQLVTELRPLMPELAEMNL